MMGYFICQRGRVKQLTRNFKSTEFDCKGPRCGCKATRVDTKLVRKLQILRNWTKKSITINSGNRCPVHNRSVGGGSASQHLTSNGRAADIKVAGYTPAQIAKKAQELGFSGVGRYDGSQGYFVHVDTRSNKYCWHNTTGIDRPVSGHGGVKKKCPYTLPTKTLRRGCTGNDVRGLQWVLNWAGYKCSVDGSYGPKTQAAVKAFQRDMLLEDDGIAGPKTLEAVREVYL